MSLNTCTVSGHVGSAAEIRYTTGGLAVVSFSVCVNERRRQQDGTYKDSPNWIDCTMFGKRAEALHPLLGKGCKVAITGHLHDSRWEHQGQKCRKIEIVVDEVELMGGRRAKQGAPAAESASYYAEDVPF